MKKSVIKGIVFALVFCISLFAISAITNKGNTDMTTEMPPATYPLVYIQFAGERINCLRGYADEMEVNYQRNTITHINEDRELTLEIEPFETKVKGLSFQVRSVNGERLIEDTDIYNYMEKDGVITADITLKDLIEKDTEYSFRLCLETEEGKNIYFYTRVIAGENYYTQEKLAFAKDFHEKTFSKERAREITKYLESNAEGDNTTFHKVNIHSSFSQITWGDLNVKKVTEPVFSIKELGKQTASIKGEYFVKTANGKKQNFYRVEEFYRIRYGKERMYLLDFERTMNQIFNTGKSSFSNNKIELGIVNPDIQMKESDGGSVVAFVHDNRLFSYSAVENKFTCLFTFYDKEQADLRNTYNGHAIQILSIDEAGNIRFMVHGYMNRGIHEGNVGIQIYHYNSALNTIEEEIFIPYTKSWEVLKSNVEQLSYVSKNNELYFILDGSIYCVDLLNHSYEVIESNLMEGSFEVSDSGEMLVWQMGNDRDRCTELTLMNLNTKKQVTIQAGNGQYIKPLGFMQEDLIYGLAYQRDIVKDTTGRTIFPMYVVNIQNETGDVLKRYKQENVYIESCLIESNQIVMKRMQKNETGIGYSEIADDQILNNEVENSSVNTIEVVAVDVYEKIVQIAVKNNINAKNLKILSPKEVLYEGERRLQLKEEEEQVAYYYVYGKEGLPTIFTNPANAVSLADEIAGVVLNEEGSYVWAKGNRVTKNQIMAITEQSAGEERSSIAVCLDTILRFEGILRNTEQMLRQGDNVLNILKKNLENTQILDLSGCSLDAMLYYVNQDIPVLAQLRNGEAVLIIGFNEMNVVLMDPITGTIYKKGMNDSKEWFEENGNNFVTYIRLKD